MCDGSEAKAETRPSSSSIPVNTQVPISKKWRFRIQEMSKGQCSTKHYLVHVVKRGETLTSISKQYGVPVYEIVAANKNIRNVDFVFEGQHLNIPSAAKNIEVIERSWSAYFKLPEKDHGSLNILNGVLDQKNFKVLYSRCVPHGFPSYHQARTIGCFLVLVPLMTFCIRCIMGAFHTRVFGELRHQAVKESVVKHHRSRGGRWRSALGDAWEPEKTDTESIPDSTDQSEDLAQISFEEASHAYRKLEHDYEEFLSQCGMSKWGYWRGGSTR
ncbi:LysM domain containing protein [Parasponia andersonii]|uniref:LysM domain containing protein n=1 Tax=Parasponia andersonii TaxID=3476 RepID=A0A2P5DMK4_PARAD|nr:LysM domain containing protein [Parasponia andersonii]